MFFIYLATVISVLILPGSLRAEFTLGQAIMSSNRAPLLGAPCIRVVRVRRVNAPIAGFSGLSKGYQAYAAEQWRFPFSGLEAEPVSVFSEASQLGQDSVDSFLFQIVELQYYFESIESAEVLNGKSLTDRRQCGVGAIKTRQIGARLALGLHIKLPGSSTEDLEKCKTEVRKFHRLFSGAGPAWYREMKSWSADEDVAKACAEAEISLNVLQMGGTPFDLPADLQIRAQRGNHVAASVTCPRAKIEKCQEIANLLLQRTLEGKIADSINPELTPDQAGGPAVLQVESSLYESYWIKK